MLETLNETTDTHCWTSKIVHRRHTITPLWSPVLCTAISYSNCAWINLGGGDV